VRILKNPCMRKSLPGGGSLSFVGEGRRRYNIRSMLNRSELLERLRRWREWPSFNEEATLLGLVLPILQEAGYDPFNPEEVFPQAKDSNNLKPDLLLYKGSARQEGAPYMVIEVKALGENLKKHENQVVQYMNGGQARWYVLTNGETWELYDRNRSLPLANCLLIRIRLTDPGALRALSLLLSRTAAEPPLQEAEEALAEALLAQAAESTPIEEQKHAYSLTGHLVKPLQAAVREARERFPLAEPFVERWVQEWKAKLEVKTPPPSFPPQRTFVSWAEALFALGAECYKSDPDKVRQVLKVLPPDYAGPLRHEPLPDGHKLCVNFSVKDTKRQLNKLAHAFPHLQGERIRVRGEEFVLGNSPF
jgi:hypothetical protein